MALLRPRLPKGITPSRDLHLHVGRKVCVAGLVATARLAETKYGETMQFMTLEDEWGFVDVTFFPSPNRERLSEGDRAAHAARSPHDIDLASGGRQPSGGAASGGRQSSGGAASGGRQPSGPPFPSATYLGMGPYLVWGTVEEQYGVITVTAQRFIKQPISPWPEET